MHCGYTGEGQRGPGRGRVLSCTEGNFMPEIEDARKCLLSHPYAQGRTW